MSPHAKYAKQEVMMHMTNVAHGQQEIKWFCTEVTYSPAKTWADQRNLCLPGREQWACDMSMLKV